MPNLINRLHADGVRTSHVRRLRGQAAPDRQAQREAAHQALANSIVTS